MRPGKSIAYIHVLCSLLTMLIFRPVFAGSGPAVQQPERTAMQYLWPLTVTVLDAASQDTLAVRCSILNFINGELYPAWPSDPSCFYHTSEGGYFYSSGTFTVDVPEGMTMIRIGRGPEYMPITKYLVTHGDTAVSCELYRTIDMSEYGWYSGDCHVHINHSGGVKVMDPGDAHFMGRAEGLGVVNCLDKGYYFTGEPAPVSTSDCIVYMSQEYRSATWGHMGLLGLSQVFQPVWSHWWPLNRDVAMIIHFQPGAAVIAAHPVCTEDFWSYDSWPGNGLARELPVDILGGDIDAFEVLSYSNCHPGGIELDMWYRFLNCGFKLPAAGGTDSGMNRSHDRPLGGYRTYVHIPDDPLTFANWLTGLKQGRTFVTNGPLITWFGIQGLIPGDSLILPDGIYRLYGRLTAHCNHLMNRAEIIRNGEVVKSFDYPAGRNRIDEPFNLFTEKSCWIAARVMGADAMWHVIGDTLFAHTSPIYFKIGGKRVAVKNDAEYFVDWIENLETLAHDQGEWPSDWDSARIFGLFAGAREFYAGLADLATGARPPVRPAVPKSLVLHQNRPNPFSAGTIIEFELPDAGEPGARLMTGGPEPVPRTRTAVIIYDVQGRVVRRIFEGNLPPGRHRYQWDGRGDRGEPAASGLYFCRVQSGRLEATRKILLIK